ncbi:MAG TPA: PAS domain S-box protein, partial [Nitrosomonas sp.]|nr:PAS domain S-box protein [Nitrosomonas sp.]
MQTFEYELPIREYGIRQYEARMVPSGKDEVITIVRDITENKLSREALSESEEKYRKLFFEMTSGCSLQEIVADEHGLPVDYVTLEVNRAFESLLNVSREAVIGTKASETLPAEELKHWLDIFGPVALTGQSVNYEMYSPTNKKHFEGVAYSLGKGKFAVVFSDDTARKRAEEALRKREREFSTLVENAADMIVRFDTDLRYLYCNSAVERMLGQPVSAFLGKTILDVIGVSEDAEFVMKSLAQVLETGQEQEVEQRLPTPSGMKYFQTRIVPEHDVQGKMESLLAITRDVTAHKLAEEALKKSEEKYRTVADFTYDWETWRAPDGSYYYVSPSCKRISGYAAGEFLSDPLLLVKITHPDDRAKLIEHLDHSSQDIPYHSEELEFRVITPNGEVRWVSHSCIGVYGENGQWLGRRGSNRDITERKAADDAMRASEERYRRLTGAITDYIYTVQVEYGQAVRTIHGPGCVAVTGYSPEEFDADPYLWYRMIWPEDRGLMQDEIKTLLAGRDIDSREHRIIRKDGQVRWIRDTLSPHFNDHHELISYDGLIQDITERKLAEEALRESEEHYRRIIDTAYEGIWVVDETYRTTFVNARMMEMLGYTADEILGKRVDAFLYETDQTGDRQNDQHLHRVGGQQERRFRRKDGSELWALVSAKPILDSKNVFKGSFAMFSDITERKRAEELIREKSEQLRLLYEASQRLNRTLDLDVIYQTIYEFLSVIVPVESMVISTYDSATQLITCAAHRIGDGWQDVSEYPAIPLEAEGKGTQSIAIRTGVPFLVNDLQAQVKTCE